MKQVLLYPSSARPISAPIRKTEWSTRNSKSVIVITPNGQFSFPIFLEVDEGFDVGRRDSIDPDDMTNEAFWNWLRQRN